MTTPLVSVIIPTFNRAPWLKEAVASVQAQTYPGIELIVVDDGSTDNTGAMLQELAPAIRVLRQEHAGVSVARNRGVKASQGELVAFLDSDDLWLPQKIATQVALFRHEPQTQACYTDEIWIRYGVRVNPKHLHRKHDGWMFLPSLLRCLISPSSIMLRRSLWEHLGGFDESLPACEDYDLWLRLTLHVPVRLLPERLIIKRGGHADQLSRSIPVLDQYRIMALEKILTASLTGEQRHAVLTCLVAKCRIVAQGARKRQMESRCATYTALAQRYQQQLRALEEA